MFQIKVVKNLPMNIFNDSGTTSGCTRYGYIFHYLKWHNLYVIGFLNCF